MVARDSRVYGGQGGRPSWPGAPVWAKVLSAPLIMEARRPGVRPLGHGGLVDVVEEVRHVDAMGGAHAAPGIPRAPGEQVHVGGPAAALHLGLGQPDLGDAEHGVGADGDERRRRGVGTVRRPVGGQHALGPVAQHRPEPMEHGVGTQGPQLVVVGEEAERLVAVTAAEQGDVAVEATGDGLRGMLGERGAEHRAEASPAHQGTPLPPG